MDGWAGVADAVIRRRVELGMRTREKLVEATGLSRKTLGEIERADRTSYDPATIATVEQSLKWPPGTVDAILRGDPPPAEPARYRTPITGTDLGEPLDPLVAELIRALAPDSPVPEAEQRWLCTTLDAILGPVRVHLARAWAERKRQTPDPDG